MPVVLRDYCYLMACIEQEFELIDRREFTRKKDFVRRMKLNNRLCKKFLSCAFVRYPYINARFKTWRPWFLRAIYTRIREIMNLHSHEGRMPDWAAEHFIDRVAVITYTRMLWRLVKGDLLESRLPEDQDIGLDRLFNQYL